MRSVPSLQRGCSALSLPLLSPPWAALRWWLFTSCSFVNSSALAGRAGVLRSRDPLRSVNYGSQRGRTRSEPQPSPPPPSAAAGPEWNICGIQPTGDLEKSRLPLRASLSHPHAPPVRDDNIVIGFRLRSLVSIPMMKGLLVTSVSGILS